MAGSVTSSDNPDDLCHSNCVWHPTWKVVQANLNVIPVHMDIPPHNLLLMYTYWYAHYTHNSGTCLGFHIPIRVCPHQFLTNLMYPHTSQGMSTLNRKGNLMPYRILSTHTQTFCPFFSITTSGWPVQPNQEKIVTYFVTLLGIMISTWMTSRRWTSARSRRSCAVYSPHFGHYSICYFPHRFPSTTYIFPSQYLVTPQPTSPPTTSRLQPVPLLPDTNDQTSLYAFQPSPCLPNDSSLCWQSSPLARMSTDHTFSFRKSFHVINVCHVIEVSAYSGGPC